MCQSRWCRRQHRFGRTLAVCIRAEYAPGPKSGGLSQCSWPLDESSATLRGGRPEKTFQQAAGFLRIKDGEQLLDSTAVHPETYTVVELMAASLAVPVAALVANAELINSLDLQQFVDAQVGC